MVVEHASSRLLLNTCKQRRLHIIFSSSSWLISSLDTENETKEVSDFLSLSLARSSCCWWVEMKYEKNICSYAATYCAIAITPIDVCVCVIVNGEFARRRRRKKDEEQEGEVGVFDRFSLGYRMAIDSSNFVFSLCMCVSLSRQPFCVPGYLIWSNK